MSLLFKVVFLGRCTSTHHKLALDALRFLHHPQAETWRQLFLSHSRRYLEGAKAPDVVFKDFKNHVLHVDENSWGGAIDAARNWYTRCVDALKENQWDEAVYAAGVLSHYVTDPFQPLHTAQSEAEGPVHRAIEWSICKSYSELQNILQTDLGGYPETRLTDSTNWLSDVVRRGAEKARPHYETLIEHYNLQVGVDDPQAGLDQESKDRIARLIGYAVSSLARVLDRALLEAAVEPPFVELTLETLIQTINLPLRVVLNKLDDMQERARVQAVYDEFTTRGKVVEALSDDDKTVRKLHAEEVLRIPITQLDDQRIVAPGRRYGQGAAIRYRSIWPQLNPALATGPTETATSRRTWVAPPPAPAANVSAALRLRKSGRMEFLTVEQHAELHRDDSAPPDRTRGGRDQSRRDRGHTSTGSTRPPSFSRSTARADRAATQPRSSSKTTRPASTNRDENRRVQSGAHERRRTERDEDRRPADFEQRDEAARPRPHRREAEPAPAARIRPQPERTVDPFEHEVEQTDWDRSHREHLARESSHGAGFEAERGSRGGVEQSRHGFHDETEASTPDVEQRVKRFRLNRSDRIADAPSVGPKTGVKMEAVGVRTVADFLAAHPDTLATKLNLHWLSSDMIRDWQAQAALQCQIPELHGHDVQLLVGSGVREPADLARQSVENLQRLLGPFVKSPAGLRILRQSPPPDQDELKFWIECARDARPLRAA